MSAVLQPPPVWLGYGYLQVKRVPDWITSSGAVLSCSASDCLQEPVEGRFQRWMLNASGWFDTPELAAEDVGDTTGSTLFAYALYRILFGLDDSIREVDRSEIFGGVWRDPPNMPAAGFRLLGYDAVGAMLQPYSPWACSPLTCNGLATQHPVNRYALLEDWDDAVIAATAFGRDVGGEPGPYVIIGIFALGDVDPKSSVGGWMRAPESQYCAASATFSRPSLAGCQAQRREMRRPLNRVRDARAARRPTIWVDPFPGPGSHKGQEAGAPDGRTHLLTPRVAGPAERERDGPKRASGAGDPP